MVGMRTTRVVENESGLGATLDRWREDGGVNAIFATTRSSDGYAATPHPQYYANTILGPPYSGGDALEPLIKESAERALAVYSTLTEASSADQARQVPGWVDVLEVDVFGRRGSSPCFRNPDYRNLWLSITEDQVKSYPLDGICFASDRLTPLGEVLRCVAGGPRVEPIAPACFCLHCQAQAGRQKIDVDRAREGYRQLLDPAGPTAHTSAGGENPVVVVFRILLRYPEVVAWEMLWVQAYLGLQQQMFGAVKAVAPQVSVGWQIPEQYAHSPLYRAQDPLAERWRYADFLCHSTVRRRPVTQGVLGLQASTADASATAVLGDLIPALVGIETPGGGADRPQAYVQIGTCSDVAPALEAGANGVIYAETLARDEVGAQLKAVGRAVSRMGDKT